MENAEKSTQNMDEMKICRLCLIETEELVNYFNDDWLQLLLTTFFEISTEISGKHPKFVCQVCIKFIERCDQFKQMCIEAEWILMDYSETGKWLHVLEVPEWLRPVQKQQSQQEDAIPANNTSYPVVVEPLTVPSPAKSNRVSVIQYQPPYPQHPSAIPVTGLQTASSYPQPLQHTSSHQPQQRQQEQELLSPPRSCSSRKTETLQPATQAESLQHRSSERISVLRYIQSTRPMQQTPPPVPNPKFHCTICPHDLDNEDQILQHGVEKHYGLYLTLCWCGKLIAQFSAIVRHLQQHKETPCCVLCGEDLLTVQYLHEHLNQHIKVGLLHDCAVCRSVFLDEESKRRHIAEKHLATETRSNEISRKRRPQQEDPIPVKRALEEPIDDVQSLMLQSPSPVQVISPPTACQQMPSCEPQQQQEQPSPSRSISAQQPETLQPAVQVVSLQEPSLEQPVVVAPDIPAASQPIQPTPSSSLSPGVYQCTICSQNLADIDQLIEHATTNHEGLISFLCICGELIPRLQGIVQHLKQLNGTTVCLLCKEELPNHQHLCDHLDEHAMGGFVVVVKLRHLHEPHEEVL